MAAPREHLAATSEKLRRAVSDFDVVSEELAMLNESVGNLPLSEVAARLSQGATSAAAVASRVLDAAKAAEAAAKKEAAAVEAVQDTDVEGNAMTETSTEALEGVAVATQASDVSEKAATALSVKVEQSGPFEHKYW